MFRDGNICRGAAILTSDPLRPKVQSATNRIPAHSCRISLEKMPVCGTYES